jgi:hypothetical protein
LRTWFIEVVVLLRILDDESLSWYHLGFLRSDDLEVVSNGRAGVDHGGVCR